MWCDVIVGRYERLIRHVVGPHILDAFTDERGGRNDDNERQLLHSRLTDQRGERNGRGGGDDAPGTTPPPAPARATATSPARPTAGAPPPPKAPRAVEGVPRTVLYQFPPALRIYCSHIVYECDRGALSWRGAATPPPPPPPPFAATAGWDRYECGFR